MPVYEKSFDKVGVERVSATNRYPACKAKMVRNKSGQGKMQLERCLKDKKEPEYVTMRKETVDFSIRSWLCSTQVGISSAVNLRLPVNRLEIR